MELTFTQCKQLANNYHGWLGGWRDVVAAMADQPDWITQPLDISDIQAIQQGGCASGAYMPAVTYHTASDTMNRFGDEVLGYLEDSYGELPAPPDDSSWSGMAVFYLSCAVEAWCAQFDLNGVDWN